MMNTDIPFTDDDLNGSIGARFGKVVDHLPPEHLAYVDDQDQISYGALYAASHALSAALQRSFPGGQQLVGLLLGPDWREMQALMGMAMSGNYYIVLDPSLGISQLQNTLDSFSIQALITTSNHRQLAAQILAGNPDCPVTLLDELPDDAPQGAPLPVRTDSYHAIYFTSGSTGQPRGVIRTHGTGLLSSYIAANELKMSPSDRITLTSGILLAMSITPSLGALLTGATIYRRMDALISPSAFYEWLRADQITIARSSIGLFRSLVNEHIQHPPLPHLRMVDTGGGAFTKAEVDRLLGLMGAGGILNVRLASNEAGNYAMFRVSAKDTWEGEKNPAGYPCAHVKVAVVDEHRNPLPFGEEGEIAVTGRYLAGGYYNDSEQTKERFVPNPEDNRQVTYYTGDIGKIAPDGQVEFIGRRDFRVKVREYTVELEAVDLALRRIPGVLEGATIVQGLPNGNNRLISYLVMHKDAEMSISELRKELKDSLPHYMVPSVLIKTEALPKTVSGKIDRKALVVPDSSRPDMDVPFREPKSRREIEIAEIWEKVLNVSPVGVEDSFFELGGDSLMSMEMILAVELHFGCAISPDYFKSPTIAHLDRMIEQQAGAEVQQPASLAEGNTVSPGTRIVVDQPWDVKRVVAKLSRPGDVLFSVMLRARKPASLKFLEMPYQDGVQWLINFVQKPAVQRGLYYRERGIYRKFMDSLEGKANGNPDEFLLGLAAGILSDGLLEIKNSDMDFGESPHVFWQDLGRQIEGLQPDTADPIAEVHGFEHLMAAYARGQGVILLSYHGNTTRLPARLVQQWMGLPSLPVISPRIKLQIDRYNELKNLRAENEILDISEEQARYGANALLRGYRLLNEGRIIRVYIDNGIGSRGDWPVEIGGKHYLMRAGWADLVIHSGARVIPMIHRLQMDGKAQMRFLPAFTPPDKGLAFPAQVQALMAQYGAFLEHALYTSPGSFRWKILENHYNLPDSAA